MDLNSRCPITPPQHDWWRLHPTWVLSQPRQIRAYTFNMVQPTVITSLLDKIPIIDPCNDPYPVTMAINFHVSKKARKYVENKVINCLQLCFSNMHADIMGNLRSCKQRSLFPTSSITLLSNNILIACGVYNFLKEVDRIFSLIK